MRSAAVTGATSSTATARRTTATRATGTTPSRTTARQSFRKGAEEGTARPATSGGRGGRGMSAWKKAAKASGGDFNRFEVAEGETYVIAFLEDGPFEIVWVHWVNGVSDDGRPRRIPRNCPTTKDENAECPLCELGVEAKPVAYFNVVNLDEPTKVYCWEAGKDAAGRVEKLYDELQGLASGALELNSEGVYAAVSKEKQKNQRFAYAVKRVKERDLDEDYGLAPMAPEQFEALEPKLYTDSVIKYSTTEELRELAATLTD